jgi:hypothetical protein
MFLHSLVLYTGKLFENSAAPSKDQLQTAIVTTQIQINRLKGELPKPDHALVTAYTTELDRLNRELRDVKTSKDLQPVYDSAQKLLELHDQVSERIRS